MPPHRVLAAMLAMSFVAGCATRPEKSTAPRAGVARENRVALSREGATSPLQAEPPVVATAASPGEHQGPAAPPDPWAGIDAEWVPYYEQFDKLLEPIVKAGGAVVEAAGEAAERMRAEWELGQYNVPFPPEAETRLRALLANAKKAGPGAEKYLADVESLLAGPEKGRMLAAVYERIIDEGADLPAEMRQTLAQLIRSNEPQDPQEGVLSQVTEDLQTKLLEQSVTGADLFKLAVTVHDLGQSVIEKRRLTRTFYDLVTALPEPHRSDVLTQIAWSPEQEATLDQERRKLKKVDRYEPSLVEEHADGARLEAIVAKQRQGFLALEQARRDTIEKFFPNLDAPGWQALVNLDAIFAEFQTVLHLSVPDFDYPLRPLIPAKAPPEAASNVLSHIPLRGSVQDRVPTIRISDQQIVFDAPAGQPTYADLLKPGNVLVGTLRLQEQAEFGTSRETTYHAELHIGTVEGKGVKGELVIEIPAGGRERLPFQGEVGPTGGFSFEVPSGWKFPASTTFAGSLEKGGPLTGLVLNEALMGGSFSFTLKKSW